MDPNTLSVMQGAAGAGGGDTAKYVEEVFSTNLTDGDETHLEADNKVINGIDLDGKGGMVWSKCRSDTAQDHAIHDTERGVNKFLNANSTTDETDAGALASSLHTLASFNGDGFTVGQDGYYKVTNWEDEYVHWSFRKAPGFFDVVKFDGNASGGMSPRAVAHDLGCKPGCIFFKNLDSSLDWVVYHKSLSDPSDVALTLNEDWAESNALFFGDTDPTSTHFYVGDHDGTNKNGDNIIAYLFADGDEAAAQIFGDDGDESIIKCGSYPGTNTGGLQTVDVGFEPQFVLIKNTTTTTYNWLMLDSMRGAADDGNDQKILAPNLANAENSDNVRLFITNNGFGWRDQTGDNISGSGNTFIYMAIRRGPMKTPEDATKVFAIDTKAGTSPNPPTYTSGFPVDWSLKRDHNATHNWQSRARLTGTEEMYTDLTTAGSAQSSTTVTFDQMKGVGTNTSVDTASHNWMFKRAPGFFDMVCYEGTGSAHTEVHNLGVVPEMMIIKCRDADEHWAVYHKDLTSAGHYVWLDENEDEDTNSSWLDSTDPTSSVFTVGSSSNISNGGSETYVAYLFASCPGVSSVGTFTVVNGGSNIDVDCGFTAGARFVMIKRYDGSGNWMIFDTPRVINADGTNDPYLKADGAGAEVTGNDYINPLTSGFQANSDLPSGDFIYLAIA